MITTLFDQGFTINHTAIRNNTQFIYIVAFRSFTYTMYTI